MAFFQSANRHPMHLSQPELLDISQEISLAFSPRYLKPAYSPAHSLPFTASELIAISSEISSNYQPRVQDRPVSLVLLPLAPHRLYAYWQLRRAGPATAPPAEPPAQLTLRIFPETDAKPSLVAAEPPIPQAAAPVWFDIAVTTDNCAQTLNVPEPLQDQQHFRAELGLISAEHDFTPLLSSNPASLPAAAQPQGLSRMAPVFSQLLSGPAPASSAQLPVSAVLN